MNISLTDELKAFVDEQVATGDYTTSSEYVRSLIRREKERHSLRTELVESVSAGFSETPTEAYIARVQQGLDHVQNTELPETVSLDDLRNYVRAGIESGPGAPAEKVLDRLEDRYRALADRQD